MSKKTKVQKTEEVRDELTAKVREAKKKLKSYYRKNKLNPELDYSKDKEHGSKIRKYTKAIEAARINLSEMIKANPKLRTELKGRDELKVEDKTKPQKSSSAKVKTKPQKYDYPLVDGKEMDSNQKKKYRSEMRSQNNETAGDTAKPKKSTKKSSKKDKVESQDKKVKKVKEESPEIIGKVKDKSKKKKSKKDKSKKELKDD